VQEWSLRRYGVLPEYFFGRAKHDEEYGVLINPMVIRPVQNYEEMRVNWLNNTSGRDKPRYRCTVTFENIPEQFWGFGTSVSEARKSVCKVVYGYLQREKLLYTIADEIENPNKQDSVSQLEILFRRGYFSPPVYTFSQSYDENGNPIWFAKCQISEYNIAFSAKAVSKKEAKKQAAYQTLLAVLKNK